MIIKFILLFTCCFSLTYFFTNNSFVPNINSPRDREPSSDVKKETKNSYKNLRCPSEQEFLQWSKELNIDVIAGPSLNEGCKIKNNRSQLAQILALAHDIKINFPKKWAPSVQNEIKSSYEYIRKNTNKLIIDLSQTSSVARNFVAQKQIELSGMFFKEEPIEALSVLIHEARHSDPRDQGHTFCVAGDIPRTAGGCDDYFSNKAENAGAYGYGTLYEFALAKYSANLDAAEKELMLSNAMTALGTRFNKIKSLLAKHSDIITVLLDDGTLAWVHPYSLLLTPLKIELPNYQEKIKKIEFSPRTGSLLLFTVTDRVFMWGPQLKATRPTSEALTETDRVLHSSRQYVPFENDVTYYTHLKTNGKLEYVKYNAELNKQVILPYPLFASGNDPAPKIPYLKYFALALGTNSFFADTKGLLYRAHHYAGQPNFINMTDIQSKTGGWKTLTGGVFYEDLILTDADGKIYETTVSYENPNASSVAPNNSDEEAEYFSVKPAAFQSHNKAKKYHRGLQLHAVIDEDGSLTFENYRVANSRVHLTFNKKIKDLVVTRVTRPDVNIYKSDNVNHTLIRECKIKNEIESVGYGSILAINFESQLISANADHTCTLLLKDKYWDSAEVVNVDVVSTEQEQIKPYPDSYLKLTNQNTKSQWIPYTRSVRTQSK